MIEVGTNTTLDGTVHNGRILICSQPVTLTPVFANMGSGFACSVVNLSSASVTFGAGIVSSSGAEALPVGSSCAMYGVTYSGGSVIYAAVSGGTGQGNQTIPGIVEDLSVTGTSTSGVSLSWAPPASGGAVTSYMVQYQVVGSSNWTTAIYSVIGTTYNVANLQASITYAFSVLATNPAGSGPLSNTVTGTTTAAGGVVPGQVTGLRGATPTGTSLILTWSAPSIGTAPIGYTITYRETGTTTWMTYASSVSSTSMNVTGLTASTNYDFEVTASNGTGAGIPSAIMSQSTAAGGASVTSVTWNLTPSGSYVHGSGSIGVNAQVSPPSAAIQFGFSASSTVPPASWTLAVLVVSNIWGAYVNTPPTAGTWYAWVEGIDGSLPTVYPTQFAVT